MAGDISIGKGGKELSMEVMLDGEKHVLTIELGAEYTVATLKDLHGAVVAYAKQHGTEIVTF